MPPMPMMPTSTPPAAFSTSAAPTSGCGASRNDRPPGVHHRLASGAGHRWLAGATRRAQGAAQAVRAALHPSSRRRRNDRLSVTRLLSQRDAKARCAGPGCSRLLKAERSTKAFCSGRCRMRAHRVRHSEISKHDWHRRPMVEAARALMGVSTSIRPCAKANGPCARPGSFLRGTTV